MIATLSDFKMQVKNLVVEERAQLACFLLETLDPPAEEAVSQAWDDEIQLRWGEIERGEVELIPASTVFAELRRKLA